MAVAASEIMDRLSITLHDANRVRWTEQDLIRALNDAQLLLLEARPDLFEKVSAGLELVPGPRQVAPSDCFLILDVPANTTDAGEHRDAITKIKRSTLDRVRRSWMCDDPSPCVQHWMQDDRERKHWWCYPPQPAAEVPDDPGYVEMRYAAYPTPITTGTDAISAPDEAVNALYYAAGFKLLERDEKFAGSPQAAAWLEKFAMSTGARSKGEDEADARRMEREG